jgi:hypothetical protein
MKRAAFLALVTAAGAALPASAQVEIRRYVMEDSRAYGGPGREYVVVDPVPRRNVIVVEGQPRWAGYERVIIDDRRPIWDPEYIPVLP